ncbi:MAG TPA: nucleotidyltransferase [Polyangiaceae bacterium]|nr:nucleotidyltransferase [Polyangiaceae bacterium]
MNPDFRDLLAAFNARGVDFLIVGAHALAAHGFVRATKDLDVWVRPDPVNAERVLAALADFGAPLQDLTVDDLSRPGLIFQIGVEPIRIDVITAIDGVEFLDAWTQRVSARFADQEAAVLSREHLLVNKRAAGREQDLLDVKWLEKASRKKP